MQKLILVRHAAATGQEPAAPLTSDGQRQALALADLLIPLDIQRVVSSPFARATQSVAPFCRRAGIRLESDDRLVERVLSAGDVPDWREHLRRSFDDPDLQLEGGESSRAAQTRGAAAVRDALASGKRCALVTHGNLLTLILNSIDSRVGFAEWEKLSNPDVFVLHHGDYAGGWPTCFERAWS